MLRSKYTLFIVVISCTIWFFTSCGKDRNLVTIIPSDTAALGRLLFFDPSLSNPVGQSCASCHSPETGFSDPSHRVVSEGAVKGLFSNRNAPSIAYSMFSFPLQMDPTDSSYSGGFFLDGHANSLEEQARLPFLNKLEMNNTNPSMLMAKLKAAPYYAVFKQVYGVQSDPDKVVGYMTEAIAAFERSPLVNPFSSKFDYYLKGQATLTDQEMRGFRLFKDVKKGNCAACHIAEPDSASGKILFTDFTYDNIGVPKNTANPFYSLPAAFNPAGASFTDDGLGGFLKASDYAGQFKVPSLRNAAVSAPYFHNGFFSTLEEVVHFYNKRDVESFPPAEIPATVNHREMGNLKLTPQEEKDIVAFMKTLTDGYKN
jgi:cytochrome c peroxidase